LVLTLCGSVLADWTTPVPVTSGINTPQYGEWLPYLSYDGLSLYFTRYYSGSADIFEAKRSQPSGPFTSVSEVLSGHVYSPWVSPDNLRMYYHDEGSGWHIKMSQRASVNDPWPQGTTVNLGSISYPSLPSLSADELTMVFNSHVSGLSNSYDMYIATRPDINSPFGNIKSLSEINTGYDDVRPFLSPDAMSIYWANQGLGQIFEATRSLLNDPFGNVVHMSAFDTLGGYSYLPSISSDGAAFYFTGGLTGQPGDIYVSYNVPEPATILLLGIGGILLRKSRRQ